jgi:2-haloacid dehalogenase
MTTVTSYDAVVFDAYGTLLDLNAAMARHASRLGDTWQVLAGEWRVKQLEYSWIDTLTALGTARGTALGTDCGTRRDFAACTADALDYVLHRHGIGDSALREALRDAYRVLDAYPEVPPMLSALQRRRLRLAILSNGTPAMLRAACAAAGITTMLDAVISVEEAGTFKPSPAVYRLVETHLGVPPRRCLFVSGNPWDTQAAVENGFAAVRVNRRDDPDEYGLRQRVVAEIRDLSALEAVLG